jgi:protein-disulfide isomerase
LLCGFCHLPLFVTSRLDTRPTRSETLAPVLAAVSKKRYLPFVLIILVALATVGVASYFYRTQQAQLAARTPAQQFVPEEGSKPGANPPRIRGDVTAPVTLEEFADFQCPPCGAVAGLLHQLEREYHGRLRVVFRHFPLDGHKHARPAALAAEAAGEQGKFWEMHDVIYERRNAWSTVDDARPLFVEYAREIGLDLDRFNTDLAKPELAQRIEADRERGTSIGVSATPTVFINRKSVHHTSFSLPGLRERIDAALKETEAKP